MKIFRLILILALGLQVGFGEGESGSSGEESPFSGVEDDSYVTNGSCSWKCRSVGNGYKTKIIGFNYDTGTTLCNVYRITDSDNNPLTQFNANSTNESCAFKMDSNTSNEYIKFSTAKVDNKKSSVKYDNGQQELRMSQFLVALVTLDPQIIDRELTSKAGQIQLQKDKKMFTITNITEAGIGGFTDLSSAFTWEGVKNNAKNATLMIWNNSLLAKATEMNTIPLSATTSTALDGFNKNNMAYFNDLFANMSKIYQHLQIFIFILIGGFFVMQIGASKLQAYLENRGESEGKQPYLHKFYIPLLMIGIFFMPIPEGNGYQSTVMQNMIRYFAQYSTTIADMAHSVGTNAYMNKIYKKMGGLSPEVGGTIINQEAHYKHQYLQAGKAYSQTCLKIFDRPSNVNNLNEAQCSQLYKYGQLAGSNIDITCNACRKLRIDQAEIKAKYDKTLIAKESFKNFDSKYAEKLNDIDKYFATRNNQLGWIDSLLTPTASILVETFTVSEFLNEQGANAEKMKKAMVNNRNTILRANSSGDMSSVTDEISESFTGWIAGRLVWMMMPGGMAIKDFILESWDTAKDIIEFIISGISGLVSFIPIVGGGLSIIGTISIALIEAVSALKVPASYYFASVLMEWTFNMIPLLAISTACLIAYVSYLVLLCKYFYISPFVTAWAMATKKVDKIIDFLLAGIAIFFQAILIVIFVHLALFLNTLIQELFVFVSVEQFSSIKTSVWNFHTNFIVGAIGGFLKIFGLLATSYISWKLIVSGPSWALGLIGLDGKQGDMITQGLENKLASRAFVA